MNPNKLLRVLSAALLAFAVLSTAPSLKAQSAEPQKPTPEERLLQLEQTDRSTQGATQGNRGLLKKQL